MIENHLSAFDILPVNYLHIVLYYIRILQQNFCISISIASGCAVR